MNYKIARFEANADRAGLYCENLPEDRVNELNLGVRIPRQNIARFVAYSDGAGLYCERRVEREVRENE